MAHQTRSAASSSTKTGAWNEGARREVCPTKDCRNVCACVDQNVGFSSMKESTREWKRAWIVASPRSASRRPRNVYEDAEKGACKGHEGTMHASVERSTRRLVNLSVHLGVARRLFQNTGHCNTN